MYTGSCHCGAVHVTIPYAPHHLTNCNCSICWRYGALWAYFRAADVKIDCDQRTIEAYSWGIKDLRFFRCRICGVVTHWEKTVFSPGSTMGVNMRNFEVTALANAVVLTVNGKAEGKSHFDA